MNISITCFVFCAETVVALGQPAVNFSNYLPLMPAPIFDTSGNKIGSPSPYVADFFWSPNTNAAMDSLTAQGQPCPFSSSSFYGDGYFFGGSRTLSAIGEVRIVAQVRVWNTNYGSSYYQARDHGGDFGFSNLFITTPTWPDVTPMWLFGLESFQLQRLPHLTITLTTTNAHLLSWPVEVTTYAVEQNPDISTTNWVTLTNVPVTVGGQNQMTVPVQQTASAFYRLISQ